MKETLFGNENINNSSPLGGAEINRYSRHIVMPEIGIEGQAKLKQAKVLVVGAGGLGCPVLQYLAAAGVGTIGIIDEDVVEETNLQRQILFSTEDIGKKKAEIAKEKLLKLNPHTHVASYTTRLATANALDIISQYDLVIDGSDNFPTRYLVNDACVMLKKPLVFGSIFRFEGQVSVFNYRNGPTYSCLFPEPPGLKEVPNCSEVGVLGVLPGIIGTVMANEALKVILGMGEVLSGKLFILDSLTCQTQLISFEKNSANSKISSFADYEEFCNPALKKEANDTIKEISIHVLKNLINSKADFQLIDVRELSEYKLSNIKGENIPLGLIEENTVKISRSKQVVVHCKSGGRSKKAIQLLQQKCGFTNLYNLIGGIEAWQKSESKQEITP